MSTERTSRWRRWSRRRRVAVIAAAVAVPVIIGGLLYFEPHAAFIDDEVDEPLAGLDAAAATEPVTDASLASARGRAAATAAPVVVSSAEFISGEHDTTGTALVVVLPDGEVVVRLEDLDTSNGPDLRVVLSSDPASDSWEYENLTELDELKGNIGDQNYTVDPAIDLSTVGSIVIWCDRFDVAFGAAQIAVTA